MTFQIGRVDCCIGTFLTIVGFDPRMNPHVNGQIIGSLALVLTKLTREGSFSSVSTHVHIQIYSLSAGVITESTFKWFLS